MSLLSGHQPLVTYARSKQLPSTVPRGTVTHQEPQPPAGLSPSEAYRWTTGRRHLEAAKHTDINELDPAGRARHFARIITTMDDLLHLAEELARRCPKDPDEGFPDVL